MKKSYKGMRAIILAVTCLMFGCTQFNPSVTANKADSEKAPRSLSMCISKDMSSTMIEALEVFSDKVSIISENRLEIIITDSNNRYRGLMTEPILRDVDGTGRSR